MQSLIYTSPVEYLSTTHYIGWAAPVDQRIRVLPAGKLQEET